MGSSGGSTGVADLGFDPATQAELDAVVAADSDTYGQIPTSGTLVARPATPTKGQQYLATDTAGGTLYEALTAGVWTQVAAGVSAAGGVSSVNTRTGAVTGLAEASDLAAEISRATAAEALLAPLNSPPLTGNPTAPTQTAGNNSTRLATTAFVKAAADAKVADAITDAVTDVAPSQNAVFDGLALKETPAGAAAKDTAAIAAHALIRAAHGNGGLTHLLGLPPLYTRAHVPYTVSDTAQQQGQSRIRHAPLTAVGDIRLVYANWATGVNPIFTSTITVRAGIENPYGAVCSVTFNGSLSVAIPPGAFAISDPIVAADVGPTGPFPYFWSRTLVTVATAGQRFPTLTAAGAGTTALAGDSWEYGASLTDKTAVTTALTNSGFGSQMYGPSAIIGTCKTHPPVIAILGDSIVSGTGDTNSSTGVLGYPARAIYGASLPYVLIGMPSEQAANVWAGILGATSGLQYPGYKTLFFDGCQYAIAEHGVNDLHPSLGNKTLAQFQPIALAYWTQLNIRVPKVFAVTLTPRTTSTDSWATTGNQTVGTDNTHRTGFNDWLRAGAPIDPTTKAAVAIGTSGALLSGSTGHPLWGFFEIADTVETARNSGIWKAAYTGDGVHPNATGAVAAAAGVTTASFV